MLSLVYETRKINHQAITNTFLASHKKTRYEKDSSCSTDRRFIP
jgi:hypothetical protein